MITSREIRNIIAVMRSIDRDDIEAEIGRMPDAGWESFRDDPYRHFLRMNDHGQSGVARVVSGRSPP